MSTRQSAGILLYRKRLSQIEFFLVHPGGPFWKNKDEGTWSIPKGEFDDSENSLDAARREFFEETGIRLSGEFIELQPVRLKSGKIIFAWAIEKDINTDHIISNTFEMEWPPHSGKFQSFPEVDKGEWFELEQAIKKINVGQAGLIGQLQIILSKK